MGLLDEILTQVAGQLQTGSAQSGQERQASSLDALLGGGADNPLASILGGLLGGGLSTAGARPSASAGNLMGLLQMVLGLIQRQPGGLAGLIDGLSRGGLQQQAQSWVGRGANQGVSPDQLLSALGIGNQFPHLAQQFGLSEQEAADGMSQLLPELVDRLTPNGQVENNDSLQAGLVELQRLLAGGGRGA